MTPGSHKHVHDSCQRAPRAPDILVVLLLLRLFQPVILVVRVVRCLPRNYPVPRILGLPTADGPGGRMRRSHVMPARGVQKCFDDQRAKL